MVEIFVKLLDEGTDCWRPVAAQRVEENHFVIVDAVPEDETWEFQPGEAARCAERQFQDGSRKLVAVARVSVP